MVDIVDLLGRPIESGDYIVWFTKRKDSEELIEHLGYIRGQFGPVISVSQIKSKEYMGPYDVIDRHIDLNGNLVLLKQELNFSMLTGTFGFIILKQITEEGEEKQLYPPHLHQKGLTSIPYK